MKISASIFSKQVPSINPTELYKRNSTITDKKMFIQAILDDEVLKDAIKSEQMPTIPIQNDYADDIRIIEEFTEKPVTEIVENPYAAALIFVNSPNQTMTTLLRILEEYHAKATFCVYGNKIVSHQEQILQAHKKGHLIAIHGYTNTPFTEMPISDVNIGIDITKKMLSTMQIIPSKLISPPYGKLNTTIKDNMNAPIIYGDVVINGSNMSEINKIRNGSNITLDVNDPNVVQNLIKILEHYPNYNFITIDELYKKYDIELKNGKTYAIAKSSN